MAKFNPWTVSPKTRTAQSKTFQDIDEDTGDTVGDAFTLTFWRRTETEDTRAAELGEEMTARFVGYPDLNVKPEMEFPPVGDSAVEVTALMCTNAATMEWSQPPFATERYTALDFIAMRARLSAPVRAEISTFMREVSQKKKKRETSAGSEPDTSV